MTDLARTTTIGRCIGRSWVSCHLFEYQLTFSQEGTEDVDEEAVDQDHIQDLEAKLLKYDPTFTEADTMEAITNRQSALVHAFLRGNEPQVGAPSEEGAESGNGEGPNVYQQQEEALAQAYRLHLNVEKIRIPEVWFQPSIAGVDCAGIAELAGYLLDSFGEEDKKKMMQVSR